jgi:cell division protein FtsB
MSGDWIGHALRRTGLKPQRQAFALATLGLVVGIIIGALYLAQAASTSTLGRQLEDLVARRNELEQTNEQLRAEIAALQSVPRLRARAQELGFELATRDEIEYLTIEGYNPNRMQIVTRIEEEAELAPLYDETFTGWLEQQWDSFATQFEQFSNQSEVE